MKKLIITLAIVLCTFKNSILTEEACCPARNNIIVGPEISHAKRTRKGGTEQDGYLYGVRCRYDYLGRYLLYIGGEIAWAKGTLRGEANSDMRLKSRFTDSSYEGRLGYTFQTKDRGCWMLTPFIGYGYCVEINNYVKPTAISLHFRNRFQYFALGFLSRFYIGSCLSVGLEGTAKFSIDGSVKIKNDPDFEDITLKYGNKVHGRIALPIRYDYYWYDCLLQMICAPFWEYRHYGERKNFPFDFADTKITFWGLDLQLGFIF